jgi:hypothetical protein
MAKKKTETIKVTKPSDLDDYRVKQAKQNKILADKPPRIDTELIEHVLDVWNKFYDKLSGPAEPVDSSTKEDDHQNQRIAAYLTMSYFLSGGKMPPEKFYSVALIDELLKDK